MRNLEHRRSAVNPALPHPHKPSPRQRLAAAIANDLLSERPVTLTPTCFVCSRDFTPVASVGDDNTERFCSERCRQAYDDGAPRFVALSITKPWRQIAGPDPGFMPTPMRLGKSGVLIPCAGCGQAFDSRGLRCCSTDCERTVRERQESERLRKEVGMDRPQKRKCEAPGCHADIPNCRKGRRVSKTTRFCSPRCARKARLG